METKNNKSKNIRVKLYERAKEILGSLSDHEREFLVNSILGDSIYSGKMSEELLKFLQYDKAMQIIENNSLPIVSITSNKLKPIKNKKQSSQQKQIRDDDNNQKQSQKYASEQKNKQDELENIEDIITL